MIIRSAGYLIGIMYCTLIVNSAYSQTPWIKTYGGTQHDDAMSIMTTRDGGALIVGVTSSNDGDFEGMRLGAPETTDAFAIKLDAAGRIIWRKFYGGTGNDKARDVAQVREGGYVIIGTTNSSDGDFAQMAKGNTDIFLMKVNEWDGGIEWKKVIGGSQNDGFGEVAVSADGKIFMVGSVVPRAGEEFDQNIVPFQPSQIDIVLLVYDSDGNELLRQQLMGVSNDCPSAILPTSDGGVIVTGATYSWPRSKYDPDRFVMKLDSKAYLVSLTCFGESGYDEGTAVLETPAGGLITFGTYTGRPESPRAYNLDMSAIWLSASCSYQRTAAFQFDGTDDVQSAVLLPDQGFMFTGSSTSSMGPFTNLSHGSDDIFVIRCDSSGNRTWLKVIGGSKVETAATIIPAADGGYYLTGKVESLDGDFAGLRDSSSSFDAFVMKIRPSGEIDTIPSTSIVDTGGKTTIRSVYPNPFSVYATIQYQTSTPSHVVVELLNSLGQRIALLRDAFESEGQHFVSCYGVAAGMYYCRVTTNTGTSVCAVIAQ